jgi:peptidyl-prolyl cis-trans isomerase SurA
MLRTSLLAALAALTAPMFASAAAQDTAPARYPVDRVVAIVNKEPILWSEVMQAYAEQRARGRPEPPDSAGQMAVAREILNLLIDDELMVQRAREMGIEVDDAQLRPQVDQQIAQIRQNFASEDELRRALTEAGFANLEEYRRLTMDAARRTALQQQLMGRLRQEKLLPAVSVSEQEITDAFEGARGSLGQRPATVTFRQIVIPPRPSDAAKAAARAKADSILAELRAGAEFEQVARRESMDPVSRELGGDLGWARRGVMLPTFEYWLFGLQPGQLSPVFETLLGYHILRVDRVQPAERKSRQILIRPAIDSADVANTRALADSVAGLLRSGAPFDSLAAEYHDFIEERNFPTPVAIDSLPESYRQAFADRSSGEVVPPFPIGDSTQPKFVVAQLQTVLEAGEYSADDFRQRIREQLTQEKAIRAWLDQLRRRSYVVVKF